MGMRGGGDRGGRGCIRLASWAIVRDAVPPAAGFGRLWTYHRVYDNFMLVILLVAIADAYLRTNQWQLGAATLAVGSTLRLPPKAADLEVIQVLHLVLWGAAIIALAVWRPLVEKPTSNPAPPPYSLLKKDIRPLRRFIEQVRALPQKPGA